MVIIARWPQVRRTAFSYCTYTDDTSLAIIDDLLRCDWLGRIRLIIDRAIATLEMISGDAFRAVDSQDIQIFIMLPALR